MLDLQGQATGNTATRIDVPGIRLNSRFRRHVHRTCTNLSRSKSIELRTIAGTRKACTEKREIIIGQPKAQSGVTGITNTRNATALEYQRHLIWTTVGDGRYGSSGNQIVNYIVPRRVARTSRKLRTSSTYFSSSPFG